MFTPEEFREEWHLLSSEKLITYTYEEMTDTALRQSTKKFLAVSGLPIECSPGMNFNEKLYFSDLKSLKNYLELKNDDFIHYYVVGSLENTSICIDAKNHDRVVTIDVEYPGDIDADDDSIYPQDEKPIQLMNSSINQLAECVLAYQRFWGNRKVSRSRAEYLQAAIEGVDPPSMEKGTFWWRETQYEVLFEAYL